LILSLEFLTDLEKKVDAIIQNVEMLRQENTKLKGELEKKSLSAAEMEKENRALKTELGTCKTIAQEQHDKLNVAAEKIKGLIAKIEAV
jgi:FtsZ-binding cell division protein ZapB